MCEWRRWSWRWHRRRTLCPRIAVSQSILRRHLLPWNDLRQTTTATVFVPRRRGDAIRRIQPPLLLLYRRTPSAAASGQQRIQTLIIYFARDSAASDGRSLTLSTGGVPVVRIPTSAIHRSGGREGREGDWEREREDSPVYSGIHVFAINFNAKCCSGLRRRSTIWQIARLFCVPK